MVRVCRLFATSAVLGWLALPLLAQGAAVDEPGVERGLVSVDGRDVPYRIHTLPVSSFPDLPGPVAGALQARGCLIPQTYEAHRPENVIHASLEKPGSKDWAALCLVGGRVSLLVFFGSRFVSGFSSGSSSGSLATPIVLADFVAADRVQMHDSTGEMGFNWGIDPANPGRVHDAQAGMEHRPAPPDHDSLADSVIDRRTVYRLYRDGAWVKVDTE